MSDQSPPPKPKPGSLRDRIAQFEKSSANAPPPVPRPKPGGISWKPKPPSPPSSPPSTADHERKAATMSASDAKESIGKAGTLKERMAMLQGKGAFGGPPPPVAPKPAFDKPKWKPPPPPVVTPPVDSDKVADPLAVPERTKSPPDAGDQQEPAPMAPDDQADATNDAEPAAEADSEEEERQRRAAIAARMARLGGARVGMGPPVFGKPSPKKPEPQPETVKEDKVVESKSPEPEEPQPSSTQSEAGNEPGYFPSRKDSDSTSIRSTETTAPPVRTSNSMPVPVAPRRAAPPRKKPAKAPSPAPEAQAPAPLELAADVPDTQQQSAAIVAGKDDDSGSLTDQRPAAPTAPEAEEPQERKVVDTQEVVEEPGALESNDHPIAEPEALSADKHPEPEALPVDKELEPEPKTENSEPEASPEKATVPEVDDESPPEKDTKKKVVHRELEERDEEDETTHRQRVAERLAKMGGVNPFAPPPRRRSSGDAALSASPPLPSPKPASLRKDSAGSVVAQSPKVPERRASLRKSSVDDEPRSSGEVVLSPSISRKDSSGIEEENERQAMKTHVSDVVSLSEIQEESLSVSEQDPAGNLDDEPLKHELVEEPKDDLDHELIEDREGHDRSGNETPPPPPLPDRSTRPDITASPLAHRDAVHPPPPPHVPKPEEEEETQPIPVLSEPSALAPAPPPRLVPHSPEPVHNSDILGTAEPVVTPPEPPRRLPPRPMIEDDGNTTSEPLPHPHPAPRPTRVLPMPVVDSDTETPSSQSSRPMRSVPPPPAFSVMDEPYTPSQASQPDEEALPTLPRFHPADNEHEDQPPVGTPLIKEEGQEDTQISPIPPPRSVVTSHLLASVSIPAQEVLDESEGDPIDPRFYSPVSPKTPKFNLKSEGEVEARDTEVEQQDDEQRRRKTIAERMAKLGGIKFGAPPIGRPPPPVPREEEPTSVQDVHHGEEQPPEQPELTEEEEELARKQRIAAKLASMGGMRLGMLPPGAGAPVPAPPPPPRVHKEDAEQPALPISPRLVHRPAPPARPPPPPTAQHEVDSEQESQPTSDDGVKVEAEESELEEVSYEEAAEAEEVPPPVPVRIGRHPPTASSAAAEQPQRKPSLPPPVPPGYSASPTTTLTRKASGQAAAATHKSQSEYVMVEEPVASDAEEAPPPPPPHRMSRPPPSRTVPPPPPPPPALASEQTDQDMSASHWELPSIPGTSFEFSTTEPDLSLSATWSEDSTTYPPSSQPPVPEKPVQDKPSRRTASHDAVSPDSEQLQLTSEELMAVWGRVGVQICEVATTLFEKSRRSLIGDGTYPGFIKAVLAEVPNAATWTSAGNYGYVIYVQSGSSVQKRLAEIMPGDVVVLSDAKLKGHKGLQAYHQSVGAEEPVLGIVSEFEPKKSKIRVFQANQHVGQQTVESVSYRLEDVKSGTVKVFRVLES